MGRCGVRPTLAPVGHPVRFDSLTGLRFLAALAVVFFHAVPAFIHVPAIRNVATLGQFGVDFFFVLSGFVLSWSYDPARSTRTFYGLRFARIYPLHILMFLVAAWVGLRGTWGAAVLNVTLLQAWAHDDRVLLAFNAPAWTLSCEVFFYALFPYVMPRVAAWSTRRLQGLGVACVATAVAFPVLTRFLPMVWSHAEWVTTLRPLKALPVFLIGMMLAQGIRRGLLWTMPHAAIAVAVVGLLALRVWAPGLNAHLWAWQVVLLPLIVVLIVSLASRQVQGRGVSTPRWLIVLGEWSFALYLVHVPLIVAVRVAGHDGPVTFLLVMLGAVALAGLAHMTVERPAEQWLRRRLLRRSTVEATRV